MIRSAFNIPIHLSIAEGSRYDDQSTARICWIFWRKFCEANFLSLLVDRSESILRESISGSLDGAVARYTSS